MTKNNQIPIISKLANGVVNYPKTLISLSLICMILVFTALPSLYKDTRADAFLADDNPALVYKNKVKQQFGLSDPIVIAIVNESEEGVFNPKSLSLTKWLTDKIYLLDNINSDRVTSLATENNITGSEFGMEVDLFFEEPPSTQEEANLIWNKVNEFPLYMGSIVSKDKKATLIVAELLDENKVENTYQQILQLVKEAPKQLTDKIHVAGEGAVAGYLGSYIDADASRLNPLAGVIITIIILIAFGRISPAILSNVVIAASVLMTLGIMALFDIAFFVITNALPVILIGIAVADSIHIYSRYFELQAKQPNRDKNTIVIQTIEDMWRPITLTTLTTAAGFLGLYFAAYMPPFKYFGLFTAVGVVIAWIYSLVFLPASLVILKLNASKKLLALTQQNKVDVFSKFMLLVGKFTLTNSKLLLVIMSLIVAVGVYETSNLVVNEDRITTFHPSEPIFKADRAINSHFNGANNLDIVVETNQKEALFDPQILNKIEALQDYALNLKNVQGATSIVDYLKQMNRSLNGGAKEEYRLPQDKDLVAQYFLIYSASSDPTDFEEEIDYDYQVANIRLNLNKGGFTDTDFVVENLNEYIQHSFNSDSVKATLSGRVTVNYHWIRDLGESHFVGLAISMFLVWAVSALLFRSLTAGVFAVLPVLSSILFVYITMVLTNINLGIGTSMFASVAIGLGVDFSIHTIDRLRSLFKQKAGNWDLTLSALYPTTGRALFFNYLAIACGFGVLISSKVVPLTNFGLIVVVSVTTSFFASLVLLPALIKVTKPKFISGYKKNTPLAKKPRLIKELTRISSVIIMVAVIGTMVISQSVKASELPLASEIVARVNQVDDGDHVIRNLTMKLVDKRGKIRERETITFRKYFGDDRRTIIFYKKPTNVKKLSIQVTLKVLLDITGLLLREPTILKLLIIP